MLVKSVHAQIVNKAIPNLPSDGGVAFARYLAIIWWTMVIFGGLAVLIYLAWGALDWILSSDNQERLKRAKDKMFNGIIGLVFLILSYDIVNIISRVTGLDILNPAWPTL
jgi:arginine exporter protein ArgO